MLFNLIKSRTKQFLKNRKPIKDMNDVTLTLFDIIIIILSFVSLGFLFIETFIKIPIELRKTLQYFDFIISMLFLIDFIIDFRKAPNKLKFMKWGWIDLLASIPSFDMFRTARIFRLFRLLRVFKSIGSITILINHIMKDKRKGILTITIIASILVIFFSSTFILYCENLPECNIKTAEDAIWWTFCTITTVGYGDRFPITTEGRMIGVLTMIIGTGLFASVTAYISSYFLNTKENK